MHRVILVITLVALTVVGPVSAVAQEGTPSAGASSLVALGYPEFIVQVNGDTYNLPVTTVPAGRTLVRLENVGEESWHGFLLQLPDGVTNEQIAVDLGPEAEVPPPWLFEAVFPGFPGEALPGQITLALVDLVPGRYLILGDTVQTFEVVSETSWPTAITESDAPTVAGTVELFDFNFTFPSAATAGQQVWSVTNTGEHPHELLLARSAVPITVDQMMSLLMDESEDATPTASGPTWDDLEPVGGMGWLSPGVTAWTEVDLTPGTYVALCFVFDPTNGLSHAEMGMIAVFTVGEDGATPTA